MPSEGCSCIIVLNIYIVIQITDKEHAKTLKSIYHFFTGTSELSCFLSYYNELHGW